jgi:prevent-host-death family protein
MKMEVGIHEAKTKLSKLIPVVLSGEEVIITKAGEPLVKLVPVTAKRGPRPLGVYEGKIKFHGDMLEPIPEEIIDDFWSPENKDEISS